MRENARPKVVGDGKIYREKGFQPRSANENWTAVMKKAKAMAAKLEQPVDLWKLESYLTRRRQRIDRQYEYRYSVLPQVFADLIREGRLREQDLQGLGDDKLEYVRLYATT